MAVNTLFRTGEQSPWVYRGHDTEALGPSDSSDSGSDMQGVGGAFEAAELGLDIMTVMSNSVSCPSGLVTKTLPSESLLTGTIFQWSKTGNWSGPNSLR